MTQGILVLIGTLLGGVLVMINQHFQSKRDDRRQQRAFERAARSEPLERIKRVVEIGLSFTSQFAEIHEGRRPDSDLDLSEYRAAMHGAILTAYARGARTLQDELVELSSIIARIGEAIGGETFDATLLGEAIDQLALIENQYIELKMGS